MKIRTFNFAAAAVLFLLAGATSAFALPKESTEPVYSAKSTIFVFNENPEANPHFLNTQILLIQSNPVLYKVIDRLTLQKAWGKDGQKLPRSETLQILKNSIHISQIPNTTLITISAKRNDPIEAAKVANETAETYHDYRVDMAVDNALAKIDVFTKILKEQSDRVDAAEREVERQREELGLPALGSGNSEKIDSIRFQQLEADRLMTQNKMREKEERLKTLENLDDKGLIERASHITFDQFALNALQQLRDIDVQLRSLATDHGDHPEAQRLALQKKTLEEILRERLQDLRNGLET